MTAATILEQLWADHHDEVYFYIAKRTNLDIAEDLTQDVYLRAYEALAAGRGYTSSPRGWLFRIAHNVVIDLYRQRSKKPIIDMELDAPADMVADGEPRSNGEVMVNDGLMPDELTEKALISESVQMAIDKLKPSQTEVVRLIMNEYQWPEIRRILERSDGAVKALRVRGFAELRLMLTPDGDLLPPPSHREHSISIVHKVIATYGPMPVGVIMRHTGQQQSTINWALRHGNMFVRMNVVNGALVWGLAA